MVQFGALGDIHGDFENARRIVTRHPDIPFWVCVGDVASAEGDYEPIGAPLYWIKGNNENFDAIVEQRLPRDLHFLPNGTMVTVHGLRIAGLGGTLAPTWYETQASALPYPNKASATTPARRSTTSAPSRAQVRDDKRRHFVRDEVDACKAMRDIDLFMSHEAPRPYYPGPPAGGGEARSSGKTRQIDAGKTPINEILSAVQPRLHLFGHHHRFSEQERQKVRSIGLDLVSKSYLLVDARTLEYERLATR